MPNRTKRIAKRLGEIEKFFQSQENYTHVIGNDFMDYVCLQIGDSDFEGFTSADLTGAMKLLEDFIVYTKAQRGLN